VTEKKLFNMTSYRESAYAESRYCQENTLAPELIV